MNSIGNLFRRTVKEEAEKKEKANHKSWTNHNSWCINCFFVIDIVSSRTSYFCEKVQLVLKWKYIMVFIMPIHCFSVWSSFNCIESSERTSKTFVSENSSFYLFLLQCFFIEVLFLIKLQTLTWLKKRLWHRRFPANFAKFSRTPFSIKHIWWLFLEFVFIFSVCNNLALCWFLFLSMITSN